MLDPKVLADTMRQLYGEDWSVNVNITETGATQARFVVDMTLDPGSGLARQRRREMAEQQRAVSTPAKPAPKPVKRRSKK